MRLDGSPSSATATSGMSAGQSGIAVRFRTSDNSSHLPPSAPRHASPLKGSRGSTHWQELLCNNNKLGKVQTNVGATKTNQGSRDCILKWRAKILDDMQFQVALSFAGEQRDYVDRVARGLQERSIAVF